MGLLSFFAGFVFGIIPGFALGMYVLHADPVGPGGPDGLDGLE